MKNNVIETIVGAIVLTVAVLFLVFAYNSSGYRNDFKSHYSAKFDRVDGLQIGSDIRLSGVKVGLIKDITVNPETFMAHVHFNLNDTIKLPDDTLAEIVSDGLLGGKYLALVPGGSETLLKSGDEIMYTQASISLEAMIGQLIFSKKDDQHKSEANDNKAAKSSPAPSSQTPSASTMTSSQVPTS